MSTESPPTGPLSKRNIIDRIEEVDKEEADELRADTPNFIWQPLSFYRNFQLLIVEPMHSPSAVFFCFADDGKQLMRLSSVPDVYAVNAVEKLKLTEDQVAPYLKFVLDDGVTQVWLNVVESIDDLLPYAIVDGEFGLTRMTEGMLEPVKVEKTATGYHAVLIALKTNYLVQVEVDVAADGTVTPVSEEIIARELPVGRTFHRWETQETLRQHLSKQLAK